MELQLPRFLPRLPLIFQFWVAKSVAQLSQLTPIERKSTPHHLTKLGQARLANIAMKSSKSVCGRRGWIGRNDRGNSNYGVIATDSNLGRQGTHNACQGIQGILHMLFLSEPRKAAIPVNRTSMYGRLSLFPLLRTYTPHFHVQLPNVSSWKSNRSVKLYLRNMYKVYRYIYPPPHQQSPPNSRYARNSFELLYPCTVAARR